jgi:hypothetical protein
VAALFAPLFLAANGIKKPVKPSLSFTRLGTGLAFALGLKKCALKKLPSVSAAAMTSAHIPVLIK